MLKLAVTLSENFDEVSKEFLTEEVAVEFEHSLVTLSKWEAKHEKPFLGTSEKTSDEVLDYIRMMIITPEVDSSIVNSLSKDNLEKINNYIAAKQTATWFSERNSGGPPKKQTITSELIYYWMISYNIPMECEHWHLNRLFTLIRVFNVHNEPKKKMSRAELAAQNRRLNEERRAKYNSPG